MNPSRREWLAGAAAALRAAAPRVHVGAHLWVWAAKQPGNETWPVLDQIFAELAPARLDGLEVMHNVLRHDGAPERLRELSKRHRLPVLGSSWSADLWDRARHEAALADVRLILRNLQACGGRTLGISVGDARRKKTEAEFDAQAEALVQVRTLCRDHGVAPNLHNHVYEVRDGEHDLNGTLARLPDFPLGPDLGWLFRAKVDPLDFVRRRGRQMIFAHLRNEKSDGKWPEDLNEGVIDYAAVGKALRELNFSGHLVIELAHERDFTPTRPYGESFARSRAWVKRVMNY
jgi:sugar phosphate isomerase/epimerase